MERRSFLSLFGLGVFLPFKSHAARTSFSHTVRTAPLELRGEWGGSARADAAVVIERMRKAGLTGVDLRSDRQPQKLRVENAPGIFPSVWLQTRSPNIAWIKVVVGTRDWCNLAYQLGHELGHVLCNSWQSDAKPRNPCQWIEEALVEALSLRGLAILADDWAKTPPFPNDEGYASSIRDYMETIITRYHRIAREQGIGAGFGAWFKAHEAVFSERGGIDSARGAVTTMLAILDSDESIVDDMGALNRWPGRSGVPLADYLTFWERSCVDLKTSGRLPVLLRGLLASR